MMMGQNVAFSTRPVIVWDGAVISLLRNLLSILQQLAGASRTFVFAERLANCRYIAVCEVNLKQDTADINININ